MVRVALRAAATLVNADVRVLWRRLVVTALEDLGIGEVDLLARIVAAARDRAWRQKVGGDWRIAAALIERACTGTKCTSANDLRTVATEDPALDEFKSSLCEAELPDLLDLMTDERQPVVRRAVAVLLVHGEDAGPAAPLHIAPDPGAVFAAFGEAGRYGHVAATYHQAFRQSRVSLAPLSLCLWPDSRDIELSGMDDDLPPVSWLGEAPSFAYDQYTRPGLAAIRRYAFTSPAWQEFAGRWRIARSDWPKAAGELLFRAEGAVLANRRAWATGRTLYARSGTLGCFMPFAATPEGMALIVRELPLIDQIRGLSFPSPPPQTGYN